MPNEGGDGKQVRSRERPADDGDSGEGIAMRVLIVVQGHYGERIADNIRRHRPARWEIETYSFPTGLPALIDDAAEFLPDSLPPADLLISLGEESGLGQMIPDIVKMTGASAVIAPADNRAWLPPGLARQVQRKLEARGVDMVHPVPFCSLEEKDSANVFIREFARHFGRPEIDIEFYKDDRYRVGTVTVIREAPCGSTRFVADGLAGVWVRDAVEQGGLLHHQSPCMASMTMDREFEDTLMHRAGLMTKLAVEGPIRDAGLV